MTLQEATVLAAKTLGKSMDMNKPSAEKFEIGVITRNAAGEVVQRTVEGAELATLLADAKVFEDIEAAKK